MGSTITMCWGWCKKKAARGVQNTSNLVDVVGVVMALKLKPDLLLHFGELQYGTLTLTLVNIICLTALHMIKNKIS